MAKVTSIQKARKAREKKASMASKREHEGFDPCDQDMTICGDCEGNRSKKKCPRLKEWLAKRQ